MPSASNVMPIIKEYWHWHYMWNPPRHTTNKMFWNPVQQIISKKLIMLLAWFRTGRRSSSMDKLSLTSSILLVNLMVTTLKWLQLFYCWPWKYPICLNCMIVSVNDWDPIVLFALLFLWNSSPCTHCSLVQGSTYWCRTQLRKSIRGHPLTLLRFLG